MAIVHLKEVHSSYAAQWYSIGKLINLELGIGVETDTHCELIIGKIPKTNSDGGGADYYRGTYYLINLHEKKVEFFVSSCFESDIEQAFENRFDRFRIVKWIDSIPNIEDFIYSDISTYTFCISEGECKLNCVRSFLMC